MIIDLDQVTEATLPALPIKDIVPMPSNEVRVDLSTNTQLRILKEAEQYQNNVVLIIPKSKSAVATTDFETRAVVAKVVLNMSNPSGTRRVKLQCLVRCDIQDYVEDGPILLAHFTTVVSSSSNEDETMVSVDLLKKEFAATDSLTASPEARLANDLFSRKVNPSELSDLLVNLLKVETSRAKAYLMETDVTKRLKMCLEDARKQKYFSELENKIDENVRKSINDSQKEYYLREKMRAIQEELGDKAVRDKDISEMRDKLNNTTMPEETKKKMLLELSRYETLGSANPESGILRTYLDFVTSLPWSTSSDDGKDLAKAKEALDKDHYGLDKVKERILEYLSVKILMGRNPQSILCLVGPPGVGKTSLAKSIARALNKSFVKESLGGVTDESEIRGHRRTYLGALPGRILQGLQKAKNNNPVFLLDEIDKMSHDYKGDPTSAMLEVLDGEQNQFFEDHYLGEPFDLSHVFFIATANYIENIPAPLRDRMEIVEISSYTEYEKFEIARRHLLKKVLAANGLDETKFSITDQAIYKIIQEYTREAGVRELERLLGSLVRKVIKEILLNGKSSREIDVDNLETYLGKPKYLYNEETKKDEIGCVTGLAYTEFGGDTLQIEVTRYPGSGKLLLTGKLGDVMKESAEAALSYVKANAEKFHIDYSLFTKDDIHLHVPEGATPKDGPSAGVTMATAIVSSFANRPVDHTLGMTGEITLRGLVLPIGGLREKSIAAKRSGLKTILIPKENVRDLDEVPESVKSTLQIIPIETIDDAVMHAMK
jgi:ATP-dependent Lon protease